MEGYQLMNTRGSYVHQPMVEVSGARQKIILLQISPNIKGLRKKIHMAFRIHKNL